MKALVDSSVLVSALIEDHPMHARALPVLVQGRNKKLDLWVAAHSLVETYSVVSTYPSRPRYAPGEVRRAIREAIEACVTVVPLSVSDYMAVLQHVAELGLSGGVVYDALIVQAARKAMVDRILTFDVDDFRRIWPEGADKIAAP